MVPFFSGLFAQMSYIRRGFCLREETCEEKTWEHKACYESWTPVYIHILICIYIYMYVYICTNICIYV